ncbi:MAG: amidase [Pseudomonas sp.]
MTDLPSNAPTATEMLAAKHGAESMVCTSLQRIAARDHVIRAWLHVDDRGALVQARELDRAGRPGPLAGIPIGVKDVFDTIDMPTTHNSPLYGGHRPASDAPCIQTLRACGAVILGKTDTTEFAAAGRNAATANPWDSTRTPGGSSSGSAAAVADGHVPIALATQTGGSTIRPASYCGVYGLKPTWGLISREGVKLYANSLDTVGWHARTLDDIELLCDAFGFGRNDSAQQPQRALRIGFCRTPFWDVVEAEVRTALEHLTGTLRQLEVQVDEFILPPLFVQANDMHRVILMREGAAAFRNLALTRGELLHADFHRRANSADEFDDHKLAIAYDYAAQARALLEAQLQDFDAIIAPSAPGVAPPGRGPGDPVLNQLWTLLHVPVLNLPYLLSQQGLPIGASLVAPRFADRRLLEIARRFEAHFDAAGIALPLQLRAAG